MGFGDLVSKVLVEMKGDTSDLKAKIKELQGVEKERAEKLLSGIEKTNKGWESAVSVLGSVGLAMETVGKFTDYARESLKEYGEYTRLTAVTAGINIEKLSDAFDGLVSQHELLTFAAQTSKGVLALNQGQMETLAQAAVALRNRGFDLEESLKKLTDAAVKGKVGGLDDLGLSIQEGASKAQTLRNMMTELNKVIAESGSTTKNSADDVLRAAKQWDDMTASLKRYSAQAFVAMDVTRMAQQVFEQGLRKSGKQRLAEGDYSAVDESVYAWADINAAVYGGLDRGRAIKQAEQGRAAFAKGLAKGKQSVIDSETVDMDAMDLGGDIQKLRDERKRRAEQLAEERRKLANEQAKSLTDDLVKSFEEGDYVDSVTEGLQVPKIDISSEQLQQAYQGVVDAANAAAKKEREATFLESTFGKIEDFDAYAKGFEMLTGAVTAGLSAWIDGSESAGQAIKKFIAGSLKSLATQLAVEALKHGAYALGSLAFGDVAGASAHGAAAAEFGAASVAAAVAAKALGGGGASAPSGSGGGPGGGGGAPGGGAGGASSGGGGSGGGSAPANARPIQVIVGEHFSEMSNRERRIRAQDAIDKALRERDDN